MQDYKSLKVWKKSHRLTLAIYRHTRFFPPEERYGLTSQMRRCSSSVPSNIAEGCGRSTGGQLHRFLDIAAGSASELEYQLLLAQDLGYLHGRHHDQLSEKTGEIKRMLRALMRRVAQTKTKN